MIFLGIDPGLDGAIALHSPEKMIIYDVPWLKARRRGRIINKPELARWMDNIAAEYLIDRAVIESVGARPGQGVSSMFKFGYVTGSLAMAVVCQFIPLAEVTPARWKRDMCVNKEKDSARARATELLPNYCDLFVRVKDHGRAEAALIAIWARRSYLGDKT